MHSLRLVCSPEQVEMLSTELWEAGTEGIRELEGSGHVILIAGFAEEFDGFHPYQPEWSLEDDTDWTLATKLAWPARRVGERVFLAPVWNEELTPEGCVRVIHNPGLASGTGEHPCTQLALMALQKCVCEKSAVADIGAGSGILAIAALRLGAASAIALDTDEAALQTARENFELNKFEAPLIAGSADCLASAIFDVAVANISGSVLVAIADELLRIINNQGNLIITGFPEWELAAIQQVFGHGEVTAINEWRCLSLNVS